MPGSDNFATVEGIWGSIEVRVGASCVILLSSQSGWYFCQVTGEAGQELAHYQNGKTPLGAIQGANAQLIGRGI